MSVISKILAGGKNPPQKKNDNEKNSQPDRCSSTESSAKPAQINIQAIPAAAPETLAAQLCPTCGSPAHWTARPSPDVLRCRECEPPPSPTLVDRLLYARWSLFAELPELEWEPDASGSAECVTRNPGASGEQARTDARTQHARGDPADSLAGIVEVACADGSVMLARPGWNDPRSVWWDDLTRLTVKFGFFEAWQILSERTRKITPVN